jgi:hypothetical protein
MILEDNELKKSSRPDDPTLLLIDRDIGGLWEARNLKKNRFIVVNLDLVIGKIRYEHTTGAKYFAAAKTAIEKTGWPDRYNFEYGCSHTQIYPDVRSVARTFGHAATAIVALELAAADLRPNYDVYDRLRILPCTYFIDQFDRARYQEAKQTDKGFESKALAAIEQEFDKGLIYQHCQGMTVTKPIAQKLLAHLQSVLPNTPLGPVRCSGDQRQISNGLATKNRATEMTVDTTVEVAPL